MIFSTACCDDLKGSLLASEERALGLIAGPGSPLVMSSHWAWGEAGGAPAKGRVSAPIYFCPFCGTRIQTREGVAEWAEKMMEAK